MCSTSVERKIEASGIDAGRTDINRLIINPVLAGHGHIRWAEVSALQHRERALARYGRGSNDQVGWVPHLKPVRPTIKEVLGLLSIVSGPRGTHVGLSIIIVSLFGPSAT